LRKNTQVKTKCDYCGKIINKPSWLIGLHKKHFCNYECRNKFFIKKKIDVVCAYCGKKIKKSLWQMKGDYKNHFCDYECVRKFRKDNSSKIETVCAYCGKKIKKSLWRIKNNKNHFCNEKCQHKFSNKIKTKCSYCGKNIKVPPWKMEQYKSHFCNVKCHRAWMKIQENKPGWIDGRSFKPYGIEFNIKLKKFIRHRDNYTCQNKNCNIPEKECVTKLNVHHIDYNKNNCDPINLIALCRTCNLRANGDRDYWKQYYQKIQIDRKVHEMEKI